MITLAEIGPGELQRRIEEQNRQEQTAYVGQSSTDIPTILPGPLGIGGAVPRKTDAQRRVLIDQELHQQLIIDEVWRLYQSKEGRELVARHVRNTRNVLKKTANALSVVYENEPVRHVGSISAAGEQLMAKAWRKAVIDEACFNLQAERWARYAWITSVVHVIPQVIEGRVEYEEILPHAADVVFDDGDTEPSILVYLSDGADWSRVAVDNERFWYLNDSWTIVDEVEHGYRWIDGKPMQPWVQWRVRSRMRSEDYWQRGEGRQLVEATLKVGVVNAAMSAARQNGNTKQKVLTAQSIDEDVTPGQALTSEHPLMLRHGAELTAIDLITPVTEFISDIAHEEGEIAEAYGVPVGVVDISRSTDRWMEYEAVSRSRQRQIKHLRRSDIETQIKTAVVMAAEGHPDAVDPTRFAATVQVKYQAHTFRERPKDRYEAYAKAMSLGLLDQVTMRMLEHPDEDFATAEREVRATIERRNEFSGMLAERNLPADAGQDGDNLAQLQGRIGGQATGSPPNPDGDEDERRDQPNE